MGDTEDDEREEHSDSKHEFTELVESIEEQNWEDVDTLSMTIVDLERFIGSIEQMRAQIQIQGRGLTSDEEQYLDRTSSALPLLRQALDRLKGVDEDTDE